jgi:hypothetical protein
MVLNPLGGGDGFYTTPSWAFANPHAVDVARFDFAWCGWVILNREDVASRYVSAPLI